MTTQTTTTKRTIRNPQSFIGKVVDSTKWNIPNGYWKCAMTGKLYPECQLEISFADAAFDKQFLIDNHIYVECADWLSDEGYDLIINTLYRLDKLDEYYAYFDR